MTIFVHDDAEALSQAAAQWLTERTLAASGRFSVSLAGGSTPRRMYELLASVERARFPWPRVHWFFGDERFVAHDHPDSNFRMVRETMLSNAPIPAENIHPIPYADTPEIAAQAYERTLQTHYGAVALAPQRPLFDVVLLGLGDDGHTASLFPGSAAFAERKHWVTAVIGAMPQPRITLTYPALESTCAVAFLVAGAGKREALRRVWRGDDLPAAHLRPQGELIWFIDRTADPRSG
jgi:6-phosphogluconolactonase